MDTNWIYLNNDSNTIRYILGEKSEKMVACIGINPSTAIPNDLDYTLKTVKRISKYNGFDSWVMYNVYPQRATNPENLAYKVDQDFQLTNIGVIMKSIKHLGIDTVWLAYGDLIESRGYLPYCLASLYKSISHLNLKWKIIGIPTKKGHPRHPLRNATESKFVEFDMENYIENKIKPLIKEYDKIFVERREFK